jgi:hypothetical protein
MRRAQRASELATAGADIEQVADMVHALTDERRNSCDEIGGVDGRRVELDRIDALRRADEASCRLQRSGWLRSICVTTGRDGHENTRGNDSVTANCRRFAPTAARLGATGPATSGHPACCARA